MTKLTNQRFFNESARFLRNQNRICLDPSGSWGVYHTEDNCCVIGRTFPKDHLMASKVGNIRIIAPDFPDLEGIAWPDTEDGIHLAQAIQDVHDARCFRHTDGRPGINFAGEVELGHIAERFGLSYTPPIEIYA